MYTLVAESLDNPYIFLRITNTKENVDFLHTKMVHVFGLFLYHIQHLERMESECARFHSTHNEMGDDVESVSELRDQYLKFLDIIVVSNTVYILIRIVQNNTLHMYIHCTCICTCICIHVIIF